MKTVAAVFVLVLSLLAPALAGAAEPTVFLEDMTWTEVRDAVAAGRTTVIVPVGGTEQSGPHMALGKHNVRAARPRRPDRRRSSATPWSRRSSPTCPRATSPAPSGHMRFAGTISVPPEAFKGVLEGAARSFRRAGFRDIVLIGDHGGYQSELGAVAAKLNREWAATPVRVHFIAEYYKASTEPFAAAPAPARPHRGADRHPCRQRRHLADARRRPAPGARRPAGAARRPRPTAPTAIRGRRRAALGQVGVDLIVAASVNAIRRAAVR